VGDAAAGAAAAAAEADEAATKADQARSAAVTAYRESSLAMVPVRKTEILKLNAEAQLAAAERNIASAMSPEAKEQAEDAKAQAVALIGELEVRLASARAELQPKLDAAAAARQLAIAAATTRVAAAEAARKATRDLAPVSVFISRKTQRLYVRQAFQPVFDTPVTIQDAESPIGTHIFTAMERTGAHMRWSVVSLVGGHSDNSVDPSYGLARKGHDRDVEDISTDPSSAKAALDRIAIPEETVNRIAEILSPRSSLIVSDETLSSETGQGTEFVVLLSGEPQGGLKHRHAYPRFEVRYDRPYWRSPFAGQYSNWWSRF